MKTADINTKGLSHALIFDGKGGARELSYEDLNTYSSEEGLLWVHFDYSASESIDWIRNKSHIDELAIEALLTEETRPRTIILKEALLLALRGVNLNPNSDPEDMISIRLYINNSLIISTKKRNLLSVEDVVTSLRSNQGPKNASDFLIALTDNLTSRMEDTISEMEERSAILEESMLDSTDNKIRSEILIMRKEILSLRRYLFPQKEAISKLYHEKIAWLKEYDQIKLQEINDKIIRYIEELDSMKDRVSLIQEELSNNRNEQMNLRIYVLTVVSAIFVPIGFLTGLLGINIGGIPGAESKSAFIVFIGILIGIVSIQLFVFKKKKWI